MGVHGLKTYIESKSNVLRKINFRQSRLVIDGSNLYFTLYFSSLLDQAHGGEYDAFEREFGRFFRTLKICKIKPFVVLDGGDDISDKKFNTLMKRAEDRIKRADDLSKGRPGQVLPILIKNVFKQLLRKFGVRFIQCVAEADWEVAALANELACPVLSNDSDFYIFDIKAGFLPLSYFKWKEIKPYNKDFGIPAKQYFVVNLCKTLNYMNKHLLPIFATILGNDYADLDKSLFPNWGKFSLMPGGNHIDGLLRWLSKYRNPKEALHAIRSLPEIKTPEDWVLVSTALTQGQQEYWITPSSIYQYFRSGEPQSRLPVPLQPLPEWFLKALANGKLNSILVNALTLHRVILNFSVQDFTQCSNNLASRPIRQVFYGLMLGQKQDSLSRSSAVGGGQGCEVEEYDRQGLMLCSSKVAAISSNLHLKTVCETPQHLRLQVFLDTLCVSRVPDELNVPPNLQLAVYVTCYWLKHAQPEPRAEFLWALLIGLVYGELVRNPSTNKEGTVPQRLKLLISDRKRIQKMPLDLEAAHAYSQWQCTLRDSLCLSQLLDNPVPEPECAWLYSGLFLHRVLSELNDDTTESLLAESPAATQLYHNLMEAVSRELDEDLLRRMSIRTRRVQPRERPERKEPLEDISNRFEYLMYEDDDEDPHKEVKKDKVTEGGDEIYEKTCIPRTRHKTKKRTSKKDPKSKKYDRTFL